MLKILGGHGSTVVLDSLVQFIVQVASIKLGVLKVKAAALVWALMCMLVVVLVVWLEVMIRSLMVSILCLKKVTISSQNAGVCGILLVSLGVSIISCQG